MLTLEIDGQSVEVQDGSTVMEAAQKLGIYVPHFCYHKKLSIAANCRMCLVEVEKAPKPLPACATPVTQGMKVKTESPSAKIAQKGVMELLLINHPLDCPICDQGGECQLQDLAVGYGAGRSRYDEPKRVVFNKNLGPLISTDMTRCIHCTRCVRFGQEVAGVMELGMANRGEHAEILSFVGKTVDSEVSGNMIDLCPVGALTSKPFRYSARTWELARRKSVSPHDSLGSNLVVQTKHNKVMRVVPFENESINECWLSDRDRFSYEGLNSNERLANPMIKRGNNWQDATWEEAIAFASESLKQIKSTSGGSQIGLLASSASTCEELYSLHTLGQALATKNIDTRLRRSDFSLDAAQQGAFWLGQKVAELDNISAAWIIGADLRADHPLIAQRLRKATKRGAKIAALMPYKPDWLMPIDSQWVSRLDNVAAHLEQWLLALDDQLLFNNLSSAERDQLEYVKKNHPVVLIGNIALNHPAFSKLYIALIKLSERLGLKIGFLGDTANSIGAHWVNSASADDSNVGNDSRQQKPNAGDILDRMLKAYVLLGFEPDLDTYNPSQALKALRSSECVIALTSYKSESLLECAHVLLPIAPFTETAGSFINLEGERQFFHAVAMPHQMTLPAWKVLMALVQLTAEDERSVHTSLETLQKTMVEVLPDVQSILSNKADMSKVGSTPYQANASISQEDVWFRVGEIAQYSSDSIVRRANALQQRESKKYQKVWINPEDAKNIGITAEKDVVRLRQAGVSLTLPVSFDASLPSKTIRLNHVHVLGGLMDRIEIEKI
ncbi:MAG: NADH-quinone oxidoreductase subunit NuoG [Pseudomonadota bacterium]